MKIYQTIHCEHCGKKGVEEMDESTRYLVGAGKDWLKYIIVYCPSCSFVFSFPIAEGTSARSLMGDNEPPDYELLT